MNLDKYLYPILASLLISLCFLVACTQNPTMDKQSPAELSPIVKERVARITTLFKKDKIVDNFLNMDSYLASSVIEKSSQPKPFFKKDGGFTLPETFESRDSIFNTQAFFDHTLSTGMLVLHKGEIVFEKYWRGMTDTTTHISWSVGKSFVSALLGIAIEDGLIKSEQDLITDYLPQCKGTGYEGVTLKDCLEMSSGVKFDENYADPNSDIGRFTKHFALNKPLIDFLLTVKPDKKPGTHNHYVSMDTQILGAVLKSVLGDRSLSDYLKTELWEPLGMEDNAQWLVDETGMEFALGGLNVTLRDYAKFGLLYSHKGKWNGQQIVSEDWVTKSTIPHAPHLMPGDNPNSTSPFGYGYQWWIPIKPMDNDFFASGIHNQYIYINPVKELVIVKTSANPHFTADDDFSKENYIDLFQTIARGL